LQPLWIICSGITCLTPWYVCWHTKHSGNPRKWQYLATAHDLLPAAILEIVPMPSLTNLLVQIPRHSNKIGHICGVVCSSHWTLSKHQAIWYHIWEHTCQQWRLLLTYVCYILATCWNLLSTYDNFRIFFALKSDNFSVFFHRNPLYESFVSLIICAKTVIGLLFVGFFF
jgi:hypothetical protein